ncbi:hypothetical protein GQ44DRAFT_743783 [Phaeosphaeriaceae sp. PMI808]|nr:hypothetical protein GQ44DRAFT_743783 [Phaeosphaeriaceae sp. PMI808]
MPSSELPVYSARDLSPRYEAFSEEDDEYGNQYSCIRLLSRFCKCDLNQEIIRESLKRLPDENVYPKAPSTIAAFSTSINGSLFLKRPKIGLLPKLMLREAETMELLLRNLHPCIIKYHGCLIKRSRIVSLILDRLPITLQHQLDEGGQHFNVDNYMRKIKSAIHHLHSLGLAHSDLTPMNIIADKCGNPVIIDYGSYQPPGTTFITASTPG